MYQDYYNIYNQYYDLNAPNYRNSEQQSIESEEIITLNQAIALMRQSVGNEKQDEIFYDKLIEQAPTEKERNIIKSIKEDERKHNQILRELYYQFTGQILPVDNSKLELNNNIDYKSNLEKALFGELEAVKKYRKILGQMPSGNSYTLLMSIMTDEIRHANEYNFLIANVK